MTVLLSRFHTLRHLVRTGWRHVGNALPLLTVLALVCALAALWWWGPQWSWRDEHPLAPLSARLAVSVALVLIPVVIWTWIVRQRYRRLRAQQAHRQVLNDDPLRVYEEAQERALDANLHLLRQNIGRRDWLYRLPWYVVLGQESAGKTSFINRSNQSFALTRVAKASRTGRDEDTPLRIDWWIGNDAVLIDPAGELISQQFGLDPALVASEGEHAPASLHPPLTQHPQLPSRLWTHFVDWLGRHRSRRPLNGAILVVDVPTLLTGRASDRKALAGLIRARLRELMEQLDTRLPTYIVLSKVDLVRGFDTFFAQLPRSAREETLGFTCTLDRTLDGQQDIDAWLAELSERYDTFIAGLNEQVFDAMARTRGLEEREDLFAFVRQLAGMKPALFTFLADIFESDRYSTPALVRGMYLTSVYQHGVPANAFVNAAANAYGLDAEAARALPGGRAATYFTDRLFQRIVYSEAGLAGDNVRVLRNKRRRMLASAIVATLGSVVVIGGWHHHYRTNRDDAYRVLERSRAFVDQAIDARLDPTGRNLLQPLNQIREAVSVFEDYRDTWPRVACMGLYQGRTIGPKVDAMYLQLLGERFLPGLAAGVMTQLDKSAPQSNEQLAALRVYRMIEDRANRDAPVVAGWMARRWQAAFPGDGEVQGQLRHHLDYALQYADTDLPQYRARVAAIQAQLRELPLPQRVYLAMKDEARAALPASLHLRTEIGPSFDVLYRMPASVEGDDVHRDPLRIDRLMTRKGFLEHFIAEREQVMPLAMLDQWTLGLRTDVTHSEEDQRELTDQVRNLYTADVIATWRGALNHLQVTDFRDLAHAVDVLEHVTGASEPLRRLVETVRQHTTLQTPIVAGNTPSGAATVAAAVATAAAVTTTLEAADQQQARRIEREFAPLTNLLVAQGEQPSYLDETNQRLLALHDTLKAVQTSPDRGQAALKAVTGRWHAEGNDPIFTLQRIAHGLPAPLNTQVAHLADESARMLLREVLHELERHWDRDVHAFYRERLAGRYPLDPNSHQDVALGDFETFFGPQGKLQQFQEQYLKLFVDNPALSVTRTGHALMHPDLQPQLQAALRIREAFFAARGGLGLQFQVQPLALSASQRNSVLNVDGQLLSYRHGPSTPTGLIWPNTLRDGVESKLTVVHATGRSRTLRFAGPWAWFRLLSQAQLNGSTASSVDVSFTAGEGRVRYRITADKPINPFTERLFKDFALPRTLRAAEDAAAVTADSIATTHRVPLATQRHAGKCLPAIGQGFARCASETPLRCRQAMR